MTANPDFVPGLSNLVKNEKYNIDFVARSKGEAILMKKTMSYRAQKLFQHIIGGNPLPEGFFVPNKILRRVQDEGNTKPIFL